MSRSWVKSKLRCRARHSSTTPRLEAKWAGRMLNTRTSSSRISWASWASGWSVSGCRSAGEAMRDRSVLIVITPRGTSAGPLQAGPIRRRVGCTACDLAISLQDITGEGGESFTGRPQRRQGFRGLAAGRRGPPPALGGAEQARIRQLAAGGIFADALAGALGRALHVEHVVGDLERLPEAAAVLVQRPDHGRRGAGDVPAHPQGGPEQRPGLVGVDALQVGQFAA